MKWWIMIMVIMMIGIVYGLEPVNIWDRPSGAIVSTGGFCPAISSCPNDYSCLDVSKVAPSLFVYNVSDSLDQPYIFDARG